MKKIFIIVALLTNIVIVAQVPANYYNSANGLTSYALKTELSSIITNGHINRGYNNLHNGYQSTDVDNYYENDGSVLDMYSENPTGTDPYNFTFITDKCGNYTYEGDCYNREHLFPQGWFASAASTLKSTIKADIHHVVPTDGKVNGFRSSYPLAEVGSLNSPQNNITNPTQNGSKLGSCNVAGYSGTAFEPIDEFKGDIARILFYVATRYENNIGSWQNNSFANTVLNGTSNQVFQDWYVNMLVQWHNQDPVSQREIDRNNEAYNYQDNANPFINHPEFVAMIWNPVNDTQNPTDPTNLTASNPTAHSIQLSWAASSDNIGVTSYDIYRDGTLSYNATTNSFIADALNATTNYCFTIKAKDAAGNTSNFSNQDCETTLSGGATGSTCETETFESIPASSGSYSNRTWIGDNGLSWSATNARTDQSLNNRTITLRNGVLTAPTTSGGISSLTVTTQRKFGGSSGSYNLLVNNNIVGTIPYGDNAQTTTISNINIDNSVSILFELTSGASTGHRVAFDDLSWTCYSTASINGFKLTNVVIYPNPAKEMLFIKSETNIKKVSIFNYLGKLVLTHNNNEINIANLDKGLFLIKIIDDYHTVSIKRFIKK